MTYIQARPTTYKGIRMRSRLEARMAASLDEAGARWAYEPRAFANESGQYLTDFALLAEDGFELSYVEVKPTVELALRATERMQIIWSSRPTARLSVVVPDLGWMMTADGTDHVWRVPR